MLFIAGQIETMPNSKTRFASMAQEDFLNLLESKDSTNTKRATAVSVKVFKEYLREKNKPTNFEDMTKKELAQILGQFYVEARTKDGHPYTKSSMKAIRAGICRYTKQHMNIDIISEEEFSEANRIFFALAVHLKKTGKACTVHHPAIEDQDLKKLKDYFSDTLDTPLGLLHKVFFDIMLHLCRRGRENLQDLKICDYKVNMDSSGTRYVEQVVDELTKNHRGSEEDDAAYGGRLYEIPGDFNFLFLLILKLLSLKVYA